MKVAQIYDIVNNATASILGETAVLEEDLSNLVDIGKAILDSDDVDNYVKRLVNHIGKVVFVNRVYSGAAPSVIMDSWEYGSVLEKVSSTLPDAEESDTWKLTGGVTYDPNKFHAPDISVKFFNSKVTFEIPLSFTEIQIKESFSNANQMNGFLSMLTVSVENSMTVKLDSLIMRTISNMVSETFVADLTLPIDLGKTGVKAVNLLKLYNAEYGKAIGVANALSDPDFIRYATYVIGLHRDRMARVSTLFNIGGAERFTPYDLQHLILLSDFAKASETFLLSGAYNSEHVTLPKHESVPYWQGSGVDYSFNETSKINVKNSSNDVVRVTGVLGVLFDRDAIGIANLDRRVTTNYNPKAEFYTNFYKFDAGYYNDLNENFIVFFIGEDSVIPANTAVPTITGDETVGSVLTANVGTWTGSPTPTYSYQWVSTANGNIEGATGSTYTLVAEDLGDTIKVDVTATNGSGSVTASSVVTGTIA